jgi:hypothetical protein
MNTMTQLSFKLTSSPPPGMASTRCVGAYDQPNSGSLDEGAVDECGKPKFRGLRDVSAAADFLAARSNSPAQSMRARIELPSSLGGAVLRSTGVERGAFGRDRGKVCTGFLAGLSGATIVGAMNTNCRFCVRDRITTGGVAAKSIQTTAMWSATTAAMIDNCLARR